MGAIGGDKGVALRVDSSGQSTEDWVESGLVQDVPALAECYEVNLKYSPHAGALSRDGGDVGVQLIQGNHSLWFVASVAAAPEASDLPGNTRVIQMPVQPNRWVHLTIDVAEFVDGSGVRLGVPTSLKIFNALSASVVGRQELLVGRVTDCQSD
jgi:hypothetical protein